jgi:DNA polymerase elongation subunit (family B)
VRARRSARTRRHAPPAPAPARRKRDPSSAPKSGDRVPYVIIRAAKGERRAAVCLRPHSQGRCLRHARLPEGRGPDLRAGGRWALGALAAIRWFSPGGADADIPIDTQYYLENQLKQPLTRLFEPVLGEAKIKSLFGAECSQPRPQLTRGACTQRAITPATSRSQRQRRAAWWRCVAAPPAPRGANHTARAVREKDGAMRGLQSAASGGR